MIDSKEGEMSHKNIVIVGGSLQSSSRGIVGLVIGTITSIQNTNSDVSFTVISGRSSHFQVSNKDVDIGSGKPIKEFFVRGRNLPGLLFKAILSYLLPKRIQKLVFDSDPVIAAYAQADAVVSLAAGDSFSDIYGIRQFLSSYLFSLLAIILKRPLIFFPQTIGPFNKYLGRVLARFSLRRAKLVFTRESFSTEAVKKLCGNSVSVIEKVDMAFLMQPADNDSPKQTRIRPRVGLNISGFLSFSPSGKDLIKDYNYIQFMREVVKVFVEKYDTDVLLVPHDYELDGIYDDDLRACKTLYASLADSEKERVTIIQEFLSAPGLKAIIGECDFFVGARLHACIAALSMGIPTVPIAYSYKFLGVLHTMDLDDLVVCDPRKESSDTMIVKIQHSFENRAFLRNHLEEKLPEIKGAALSCGKILNDLIS